jgi:hypothetical protein
MFLRDEAVRMAALSEYVGRRVALGTTSQGIQPDGHGILNAELRVTKMADQLGTISNAAAGP